MKRTPTNPPGVIRADELYTLAELRARLGLGYKSVATLRREGLRLIPAGRQKYALGSDVLKFFERLANEQSGATGE